MNLSKKGNQLEDTQTATPTKAATLNPNAAVFVPFALRSSTVPVGSSGTADSAIRRLPATVTAGKTVLDRSESYISNNSDEEAQQYWQCRLPDDITPDFKVVNEDDSQALGNLSLAGLSLYNSSEASRISGQPELSHVNGNLFAEKMGYSAVSYGEDPSTAAFSPLPGKPWDKAIVNNDQFLRDVHSYKGNSKHGLSNNMLMGHGIADELDMNPLEFLVAQFPGFAAESLEQVYFANGCDFNSTVEMLTQLELQVDGGFGQNVNSKASSVPNLSSMDFPALTLDAQNALQQSSNKYRSPEEEIMLSFKSSSSIPSRGGIDFASAVRKLAAQESMRKHEGNGLTNYAVGSSRNSNVSASAYSSGQGVATYADRSQTRGSVRVPSIWLETGEAVGNLYTELREEARDHARIRNAYFEQARQAYLIGNKALAKELSAKGQFHNIHMKAAHGKAQESIYRQRNPAGPGMQGNGRGNEQIIDLHGLHVTEAIRILKHELSVVRSAARATEKRLQVHICVGTGHHTRGSRTPARLPIAVQSYLLEEGLNYSEPQPGLLRVVIS